MNHVGPISGIAVFQNYIATAGYDNKIILWDAKTKKALARSLHDHLVNQCAFSPDGKLLVSASSDYSARIWEIPSLRLKAVLVGHQDDVEMAVFSPSGQHVTTCSRDHTIKIFDISGKCLTTLNGHNEDVLSVLWSPDGATLVSSSDDGTVRNWDVAKGIEISNVDIGGVQTDTLIFTREGLIIAGDDLGRIILINDGRTHFKQAHEAGIKRLIYNESSKLLASLSYDRKLIIWEIDDNTDLLELSRSEFSAIIWPRSGAFWGENKLVLGTFGSSFAVFDYHSNTWDIDHIQTYESFNAVAVLNGDIYAVGDSGIVVKNHIYHQKLGSLCNFILPFGKTIITGGQLGQLFDAISGQILYQHHSPLNCGSVFQRNGKEYVIIGTYTGEGLIFAFDSHGKIHRTNMVQLHDNAIKGVAANDNVIFSVCASAAASWHDIKDFSLIKMLPKAHDRIANGCCLVKGEFASIGRDLKLKIWSEDHNLKPKEYFTPHLNSVKCIASSKDGKTIATGSYGGSVALFDMDTEVWCSFEKLTTSGISSLTFDSKTKQFLASSYNGTIYCFQVPTLLN